MGWKKQEIGTAGGVEGIDQQGARGGHRGEGAAGGEQGTSGREFRAGRASCTANKAACRFSQLWAEEALVKGLGSVRGEGQPCSVLSRLSERAGRPQRSGCRWLPSDPAGSPVRVQRWWRAQAAPPWGSA